MKNLQISIFQKRKEKYLKLQDRFLTSLKKGGFEEKHGRSKHHWVEQLKKLEKQLGLSSTLKLKHWALAFALGFITIAGGAQAQQKQDKRFAPFKDRKENRETRTKKRSNTTARTEAVAIFSEQPLIGDALLSENQFVGDMDGDGDDDLVMFSYYEPTKIFVNDGTGNIRTQVEIWTPTPGYSSYYNVLGDIDGDSDLDIVIIEENNSHQSRFTYLINQGSNVFTSSSSALGSYRRDPQLSDFDNDGDLDLLVQEDTGGYTYVHKIFDNDGTGTFTEKSILTFLPQYGDPVAGLFNADAFPDLTVISADTVSTFINDGTGGFTAGAVVNTVLTNYNNRIGASKDIDGDGDTDLILYDSKLGLLTNDGTGLFTESLIKDDTLNNYLVWFNPVVADFNADSFMDVMAWETDQNAISNASGKIFLNDGTNAFTESAQTIVPTSGSSYSPAMQIIDFDGDTDTDIILSGYFDIELFQNDGTANFTSFDNNVVNVLYGSYFDLVDLDGDTDLDVVMSYMTPMTLINDGAGNFTKGMDFPGNSQIFYQLATADFDNDGDNDVVFTDDYNNANQISLWNNNGTGTFTLAQNFATTDTLDFIGGIKAGDINGDAAVDLITVIDNGAIHQIGVWTNDGAGSFTNSPFTTTNRLDQIELVDIDGDGDLDLIGEATDTLYTSLGLATYINTAGSFSAGSSFQPVASAKLYDISVADIDGDGDMDVLGSVYSTQEEINLFTNDGTGNFISTIIATSYSYGAPIVEDFDLDGDMDLFVPWGEYGAEFWTNDGIGNFTLIGSLDTRSYGTAAGDIDGDGDKDIFALEYYVGNRTIINNTNGGSATPLELDSAQLVIFYNETGGANWTDKTNWTTGDVSTWFGVTATDRVTSVVLENNNLTSAFSLFTGLDALTTLDISGNQLSGIPDFTGTTITTLDFSQNALDFGDLEVNAGVAGINYASQDSIGTALAQTVPARSDLPVSITTPGTVNQYQWYKDGVAITGATASTHTITAIRTSDVGDYYCEVTNTLVSGLTLTSRITTVDAQASISGTVFLDATGTTPLNNGDISLLRITNTDGYDTTSVISVGVDGTYIHTNALLGEYIAIAQADTIAFPDHLPTYWGEVASTIFWEEADTIRLDSTIVGLNVFLEGVPAITLAGTGVISGFLEEEVPTGGRTEAKRRVAGAGVSVRRQHRQGRQENHGLELVDYVYTNDLGEFNFDKLEEDTYTFNVQYPGYPMDPNSFVEIPIGAGNDGQVEVAALVAAGKIVVTQVNITGLFENSSYPGLKVYPNPTNEYLFIDTDQFEANEFELIFNTIDGKEIKRSTISASDSKTEGIDISMLNKGVYILQVYNVEKQLLKTVRMVISDK